jgi:hypothetical protein
LQDLEWCVLGEGDHLEVVVNVTEVYEISEVKDHLGKLWAWDSTETRILPGDDEEGATEWLVLIGARKLIPLKAVERVKEMAAA